MRNGVIPPPPVRVRGELTDDEAGNVRYRAFTGTAKAVTERSEICRTETRVAWRSFLDMEGQDSLLALKVETAVEEIRRKLDPR